MNVVTYGSSARIYSEDVKTSKTLPLGTYDVCFNPMSGFSLFKRADLVPNEQRIYGDHPKKVEKVLKTFDAVSRNLGVILSGHKGSGKSLFVRILAGKALENNIPVVIVSGCYPGIADFISSIEQEILVIFDEFEKIFSHTDDEHDPQDELLPLFDGMDNGKKLFVVTCNRVGLLNDCLLNRPGRFHYHFDVKNPSEGEIRAYMTDNLKPEYHESIEAVVRLSAMTDVTYDFLRAISFELNQGYSLAETMQDLNISDDKDGYFDFEVVFENGAVFRKYDEDIDLNNPDADHRRRFTLFDFDQISNRGTLEVIFKESDVKMSNGQLVLDPQKLMRCRLIYDEKRIEDPKEKELIASGYYCAKNVRSITFIRSNFSSVNRYMV